MSITNTAEKSIVVRAVQRRRYTDTDGRTVRRTTIPGLSRRLMDFMIKPKAR
jgi:hypothetical protein